MKLEVYKQKIIKRMKAKKAVKKVLIPMKYYTAVATGVAFLDITLGRKTWLKRMNMSLFDINGSDVCVAGNVWKDAYRNTDDEEDVDDGYDNFQQAMRMLNAKDKEGVRFGFYSDTEKGMQYLQDIWVATIKKLKKGTRSK